MNRQIISMIVSMVKITIELYYFKIMSY